MIGWVIVILVGCALIGFAVQGLMYLHRVLERRRWRAYDREIKADCGCVVRIKVCGEGHVAEIDRQAQKLESLVSR